MKDIRELLRDSETEKRRLAVESLRGRGDDGAMALLIEAMKDPSWRIRKAAAAILREGFEPGRYLSGVLSLLALEDNAGARNSGIDLLVGVGKTVTPFLIEAFRTDNNDVRKFIIDIIGEISDRRALPLLLGALNDRDENVRASAVEHLGKLRESSVVDALVGIMNGGDIWTAYPAADALGRIGDPRALPALVDALGNKTLREPVLKSLACFADPSTLGRIVPLLVEGSRSVKEEVLRTIGKFYKNGVPEDVIAGAIREHLGEGAFEILMNFAWSSKADIRLSAILLLGILKDKRAVRPLLDMSSEEEFVDEIRKALVFIGRAHPDYILSLFGELSTLHRRFITGVAAGVRSGAFFDLFVSLLGDEDGHVRAMAARGLGGIEDVRSVAPLIALMSDPYIDVQEAVLDALVRLRKGLAIDEIAAGLSNPDPLVRRNTALLLGRTGAAGKVHAVGFLIKDPRVDVRKAAVDALSLMDGPESARYLMLALTDEVPMVRIGAAYALGRTGTAQATDALVLLLSDPEESVRVAAAKALSIVPDERVAGELIDLLGDKNGFVVTAAIEALGRLRTGAARDAIVGMLGNPDDEIRRTAIRSLAGFPGIEGAIRPFLHDPDWAIRKTAVEVFGGAAGAEGLRLLEEVYDGEEDAIVRKTIEAVLRAHR